MLFSTPNSAVDMELHSIKKRLQDSIKYSDSVDEEFVKWQYYCLVYDVQLSDKPLSKREEAQAQKIWQRTGSFPETIDQWVAKYCRKKGFAYHFLTDFDSTKPFATFSAGQTDKIEELYQYHKAIAKSFQDAKKINYKTVTDFISNPRWPDDRPPPKLTLKNIERVISGLKVPQPVALEQARDEVNNIGDREYASLAVYAGSIGTDLRKTVSAVLDFIAAAYAVPSQTIQIVEGINSKRSQVMESLEDLLDGIESNGSRKKTGIFSRFMPQAKPRLLPFEDTPLYTIFNDARSLPDLAKDDNALYQRQIQATQLAIEVILSYDDSLQSYETALQERVDKIKEDQPERGNENLSARDVVDLVLSNEWEDKLSSLKSNRAFAKLHAGNLAKALDQMTDMQLQIESVSGLSANLALPYRQAQSAFMSYQASEFGRVSELSAEMLDVTGIPSKITRQQTYEIVSQSLKGAMRTLEDLSHASQSRKTVESVVLQSKKNQPYMS